MDGDTIEIPLRGGKRRLLLNFRAFITMEKYLKSISKDLGLDPQDTNPWSGFFWDNFSPVKMNAMIWAGLLHEDKGLTPEAVEDLIELRHFNKIQKALAKAFKVAMKGPDKEEDPTSRA